MSKEAETLINEIQFKTGLSLDEIAEQIGYSRPYLNNIKLKGGGGKIIGILKEKFADILQNSTNVSGATPEGQTTGADKLAQSILNLTETNKSLAEQSGVNSKTLSLLVDRLLRLGTEDFQAFLLGPGGGSKAPFENLREKQKTGKTARKGS